MVTALTNFCSSGGTTALIATYILGSRRGRFYDMTTGAPLETPKAFPGHSVSLQILGSFILWFGCESFRRCRLEPLLLLLIFGRSFSVLVGFGFNSGSALLLEGNPYQADIGALCAVNTFMSSAGGALAALFLKMVWRERTTGEYSFDLMAAMNGMLSGLVTVRTVPDHAISLHFVLVSRLVNHIRPYLVV
jgi:ammonium transporter, Amt family